MFCILIYILYPTLSLTNVSINTPIPSPTMSTDDSQWVLPANAIQFHSGVVVYQDKEFIIKRPYMSCCSDAETVFAAGCDNIKAEKLIYEKLRSCEGVVPCLDAPDLILRLPYREQGTLRSYLRAHNNVDFCTRVSWMQQIAATLARIHDRGVAVVDLSTSNLLLTPDLQLEFCDFGVSTTISYDDAGQALDCPYSFENDIGDCGAVFYEILMGTEIEFIVDDDPSARTWWPDRSSLPSTSNLLLGHIIEACWTKGTFSSAHELSKLIDSAAQELRSNPSWSTVVQQRLGDPTGRALSRFRAYCWDIFSGLIGQKGISTPHKS